ncbi:hypothetical protein MIZ01_2024 [Sideroxyarcus emersonii]|uniref:Uncharacterized protein n=1 Tax=Sideroxyarcus emersonii TaxID=2764705 RepID=A0AAN2BZK9_9PROT|nr:hypothetical protein [Sideroxyarcus emersonii]BCK88223.1 hypothetical protein MIZ01_2024 [Sideroxyarcus emersonii]
MSHENSQLDISDRQLLPPASPSVWTEIGEAEITHNIFGRAKVRIIRKHDNVRRALWLVVIVAVAAIAWQGWLAFRPVDALQSADSLPHAGMDEREMARPFQPEPAPAPAPAPVVAPPMERVPAVPAQTETIKPEIAKPELVARSAPQPASGVHPATPIHRPFPVRPPLASKPAPAEAASASMVEAARPLAASQVAPQPAQPRQPGMPYVGLPRKPLPATQSAGAVSAVPRTPQRAAQAAASSPAAVAPRAAPQPRDTSMQSPVGPVTAPAQPDSSSY